MTEFERRRQLVAHLKVCLDAGKIDDAEAAHLVDTGIKVIKANWVGGFRPRKHRRALLRRKRSQEGIDS
jgi:hypothetical protein